MTCPAPTRSTRHILAYLHAFADKHDIRRHCRFACRVQQATYDEAEQCWQVRYTQLASGEEHTERYADVVAASGLNGRSSAHIPPELAAQCEAAGLPYCHSSAIKRPCEYAHKRVLVVGLGVSGGDMAAQLAQHAERVYVAARTPQYFLPELVWGQPIDRLVGGDMPNVSALPRWLADAVLWAGTKVLRRVERRLTAPYVEVGLKRPEASIMASFPIPDDGSLYAALKEGKVQLRNAVRSFSAGSVQYAAEGAAVRGVDSDRIDCVVFCTGYRFLHPYLPDSLTPRPRRPVHIPTGRYPDVGQLTAHTLTSSLTFLLFSPHNAHLYSMTEVQAGFDWMVFQDQAVAIVATILARRQRTERARRFDRVVAFPNIAFTAMLLGDQHEFRPNEEMVAEQSLYTKFIRQYVAWLEGTK